MFKAKHLHNQLFVVDDTDQPDEILTLKKGRSSELNEERNACFIDRYYFIGRSNPDLRSDALVRKVARQFFISEARALDIIKDNLDALLLLKKLNPSPSYFQRKWEQFKW